MISAYVDKNWKPKPFSPDGWEVKARAQHAAVGVAQLVAGAADIILAPPFFIPALYSDTFQKKWTTIEMLGGGIEAINSTLPKVVASFLGVMKPDVSIRLNKNPYFCDTLLSTLNSKVGDLRYHRSPLVSQVAARMFALYIVPVSVISVAMDIVATPFFLAAAIIEGGGNREYNERAANSFKPLDLVSAIVSPIIQVFTARI